MKFKITVLVISLAILSFPVSANWWNGWNNANSGAYNHRTVQSTPQGFYNAPDYKGTIREWAVPGKLPNRNNELALNYSGNNQFNLNAPRHQMEYMRSSGKTSVNDTGQANRNAANVQNSASTYGDPSHGYSPNYQGYGSNTSWGNASTQFKPVPYSVMPHSANPSYAVPRSYAMTQNYRVPNPQTRYQQNLQHNIQRFQQIQQAQIESLKKQNEAYIKQLEEQQRRQLNALQGYYR